MFPALKRLKPHIFLLTTAVSATVISLGVSGSVAHAENPDAMRQLLQTLDCENCDLSGANLGGLDLSGANLQGANLQGAQLNSTDLSRANLREANLQAAKISRTNFQGANLQAANLANAQIRNLCLNEDWVLDLTECVTITLLQSLGQELCDDIYEISAQARGGGWIEELCLDNWEMNDLLFFYGSPRVNPFILGINLLGADLWGANLSGVNLTGSDLRYAQLTQTNLQDTNLAYALLFNAELDGVQNANFDQAFLTQTDVGPVLGQLFEAQDMLDRQMAGSTSIGAMNRAQQAYYLEYSQFAEELDVLGVGIPPETETYRYVISQVTANFVIQQAIALEADFNHYLGLVYVVRDAGGRLQTQALLCRSADASTDPLAPIAFEPPANNETEVFCPDGWQPFL
ncbi:MAG: hypothetical protein F6K42_32990 [Leptolyngbya sp. SIO1D8]|nr:hypothetical protein [Leptolyngbya sp. SIO1D8]